MTVTFTGHRKVCRLVIIKLSGHLKTACAWVTKRPELNQSVVNFRCRFFFNPDSIMAFYPTVVVARIVCGGEGREARASFISLLTVAQPRAFSALSRARACILPLVTPDHACKDCYLHNKIVSVLH